MPLPNGRDAGVDRAHRVFSIVAVHRNEAAHPKRARENRHPFELGLVEDVHTRMERREQQGRIDVALMVGAIHGRPVARQVLGAGEAIANARQRERQPDAAVAQYIEDVPPAEHGGQQHADEAGHEHVKRDDDVGDEGADGGDDQRAAS